MSPAAAVDFRSPPTSKPSSSSSSSSSSSLHNANLNNSTPIHLPDNNHDQTANPPVFGNGSEFVHINGNGPAVSGRARPRLMKQRRQLHGRSRGAVSGESVSVSGFNPFKSDSQDSGRVCTSNSGSGVSNVGFVFGANGNKRCENVGLDLNSTVELDSKVGECGGNVRQLSEKEGSLDSKSENGEFGKLGFVFGANRNNVGVKWNLENRESSESCLNASELECEKDSHNEFDDNGSESNKGGSDDVANCDGGSSTNVGVSGSGFVFGASWFDAAVNLDERKKESGESSGNSVSNDTGKIEVGEAEHHKMKVTVVKFNENRDWKEDDAEGVFVFDSSSKGNFSCNKGVFTNRLDEIKSSSKTFNVIANNRNGKLDSSINDSFKLASSADNGNVASASSMNPVSNLSEEMKKLNITDIKDADGVDNKNSSSKGESLFEFRSSGKTAPSNGNSDFSSPEQNATKGTDGYESDSNHKYRSFNAASASIGKSSSELFTFQAGSSRSSVEEKLFHTQVNDDIQHRAAATPTSFSSVGIDSQANGAVYEATTAANVREENDKSSSTSSLGGLGLPFSDFKTPWDPSCLKTSLFPELSKKLEFTANSRSKKGRRSEMRVKLKQHSLHRQQPGEYRVQNERSAQENLNSPGCYSPMDFSPYEETAAAENFSKETSETLNDSNHQDSNCVPSTMQSTVVAGLNKSEALDINKDDEKTREMNQESSGYDSERCFMGDYTSKGLVFEAETACSGFNIEKVWSSSDATAVSVEDAHGSKTETYHQMQFSFASGLEDVNGRDFFFSASSSEQISSSARRMQRKKNRRKLPCKPLVLAPSPNDQEGNVFTLQNAVGNKSEANEKAMQCPISSTAFVQEVCETWRARGNDAYQNGDMLKAEDYYTCGINSVPSGEISGSSLKSLVVCYSNRAATRMSLGNLRGALRDCVKAAALDPHFLKVQMRAANCHLRLGEAGNALQYFNRCLKSGAGVCLDRRITIEAADGLQKAQKVADCINRSAKLLEQRKHDAALSALDAIAEALLISPYSERLLEMKAEFLFMLRKHTEAIQLCEQTLGAAEKNFSSLGADGQFVDAGCSERESCSFARAWRWHLISKSYFYMGKVEASLDLLEKLEQMRPISFKYASANKILESSVTLAVTIRDLLHHKSAGNEAVRSGQYTEAAEHYTAALSNNIESRPFAAICFGNRAAAHQALGQIADAIADCSLAIALDGNYSKPVSRRAALHELIRDYGQAANDLRRLVSLLENQSHEKARQSGTPARSSSRTKELRQARRHLSLMEEEAKKGIPLDLYRILGVKDSDTSSDIKKAYRKAALKHHPDKAGQFLARSESGDDGLLWKEIVQEVHRDADRLFKMIGEAYAVLSDPTKRAEYDLDEEIRKPSKENNGSTNRTSCARSNPYERNDNRRYWQDNWKTHGYSRPRW